MSSTLVLDATPASQLAHPEAFAGVKQWLQDVLATGRRVVLPELADYEARRGFIHLRRKHPRSSKYRRRVQRLDELVSSLYYAPITTAQMRRAAEVWGDAKSSGLTFGPPKALSGDAILIAQAESFGDRRSVTVITANPGHLTPYVKAVEWEDFEP